MPAASRSSAKTVSRRRRREWEERAKEIRLVGQMGSWSVDDIVDEIRRQLPEVLPLEAHRFAFGWTREQLSQAIDVLFRQDGLEPPGLTSPEICGWEHGRHLPKAARQDDLARVYRTRPDRLGFGRDHSEEPAELGARQSPPALAGAPAGEAGSRPRRPRRDRQLIGPPAGPAVRGAAAAVDLERLERARRAPREGDLKLVESLRAVTLAYADQRQSSSPALLIQPVLGHLGYLQNLSAGAYRLALCRELGSAIAEASVLAGWLLMSLNRLGPARAHYLLAQRMALEAGNPVLGAEARVFRCTLLTQITHGRSARDTEAALALLDEAAALGAILPGPLQARLEAQRAEEHATLGQADQSRRALARARRAAGEITAAGRVGLYNDWSPGRIDVFEGTCQLLLGQPRGASAAFETALGLLPAEAVGPRACATIDLGAARLELGELEEGARRLGEGFADAQAAGRESIMRRAQRARQRLRRVDGEPAIRALDERLGVA